MCIAAIIHEALPQNYLNEMERDNPHGGGVAWFQGASIRFRRGVTAKQVGAMQADGSLTYPYLLHFRWATHGPRIPQLTHPFPLGKRAFKGELHGAAPKVLIHNGVWNGYHQFLDLLPKHINEKDTSDTAIAAYLAGTFSDFEADIFKEMPWACAVGEALNGKMVITKYGDTWTNYNGPNEYSNLSWLPASEWWQGNKSKYSGAGGRNSYMSMSDHRTGWSNWPDDEVSPTPFVVGNSTWCWDPVKRTYIIEETKDKEDPVRALEPLLDEYQATGQGAVAITTFDSWDDYVRARYGDETAEQIRQDACIIRATDDEGFVPEDEQEWQDLVSDDPADVNRYLAQEYLKAG